MRFGNDRRQPARTLALLALALLAPPACLAHGREDRAPVAPPAWGPYRAAVVAVREGYRLELNVALWPTRVERVTVRLRGIKPPRDADLVDDCGVLAPRGASAYADDWLAESAALDLSGVTTDARGEVLARVALEGRDLGTALVRAGLAVPDDAAHADYVFCTTQGR